MLRLFSFGAEQRYLRYVLVSLFCLSVDLAIFFLLLGVDMLPAAAASIGYLSGTITHWMLSTRMVFKAEVAPEGSGRLRQKICFLLSALCGSAVTALIVNAGVAFGLAAGLAKVLAIGVSFQLVWLLRRSLVFK
jgi:putative flippase GtrA